MGFLSLIGSGLLGIGRKILGFLKACFAWLLAHPLHAAIILLTLSTVYFWHDSGKENAARVKAETALSVSREDLKTANAQVKAYASALLTEKNNHRQTIKDNNAAVQSIVTVATKAADAAASAGRAASVQSGKFTSLAAEFGNPRAIEAICEARIAGEEQVNDLFIQRYQETLK